MSSPDRPEKISADVKKYACDEGADLVGIASADKLNHKAPIGQRPSDLLSTARSVVVMAVHLVDGVLDRLPESWREFNCNYFESTDFVNALGFKVARFLERRGYRAYPISYGSRYGIESERLSSRHAAVEAGLGQIGLNNLLLTPQYGPRIRLIAVLTEAKLAADKRFDEEICAKERCGHRCVAACPAKALTASGKLDYQKCLDYNRSLPVLKGGDAARCGMCMAACPRLKSPPKT